MRIKKFNNLWAMGLILVSIILIVFYVIKIVNPYFIVGIAETPAIVKFGKYIDTHKWASINNLLMMGILMLVVKFFLY